MRIRIIIAMSSLCGVLLLLTIKPNICITHIDIPIRDIGIAHTRIIIDFCFIYSVPSGAI